MPQLRYALDIQIVNRLLIGPDAQSGPIHHDSECVPFTLTPDIHLQWSNHRKDRAHGFRSRLFVSLVKDVDLHPAPGVASVLRCMEIDAGVRPTLDEKLPSEIEVLVLPCRTEPGGKPGA